MQSNSPNPLSVVILAFNSANTIAMVIESVKKISDDVVVMDSGSTDDTRQICESLGTRWIYAEWKGYSENKNLGSSFAQHSWILSIDSDEVVSPELAQSILEELSKQPKNKAFKIRFRSIYCGHRIRFGGWNPEYHIRLFNKNQANWALSEVHEYLHLEPQTGIETLSGRIDHYSFPTVESHYRKMEVYADLFAKRQFKNGKNTSLPYLYLKLVFQFLKEYIFKLGMLDGFIGLKLAFINTQYTLLKYKKLRALHANS